MRVLRMASVFIATVSSTASGALWETNATPNDNSYTPRVLHNRIHEWDSDTSTWEPLRGSSWVDVGETLPIGSAVGDWPDCTSGGADDKTAATAITDFSGLTGYDGQRIAWVEGLNFSIASANRVIWFAFPGYSTSNYNFTDFFENDVTITTTDRKFLLPVYLSASGTANIWCSGTETLQGTPSVKVLALTD